MSASLTRDKFMVKMMAILGLISLIPTILNKTISYHGFKTSILS